MASLEFIYLRSPAHFQNVATSLYGAFLRWQRTTSYSRQFANDLADSEKFDKRDMEHLQDALLKQVVDTARRNVPYYKTFFANWRNRDIEFRDFPIVTKQMLRSEAWSFVNPSPVPKSKQFALYTSGTTGSPLKVVTDRVSRSKHYAFFSRMRRWANCSDSDWRATFYGRPIMAHDRMSAPYWRYDVAQRNVLFSSYHISPKSVASYAGKLRQLGPPIIMGYPSSLGLLASLCLELGLELTKPKLLITTAETLTPAQRNKIEAAFGQAVTDQYGSTEMSHFVSQCEVGSYHIHPEHGLVEILDENDAPVPYGVTGRIVATGFINQSMPVLRYDTGDMGSMSAQNCVCGRNMPILSEFAGRSDDSLVLADGRRIGRLDPVFKSDLHIREAQICQERIGSIVVRVVPETGFDADCESRLRHELSLRLGQGMGIEIVEVAGIPRSKNGKFRAVISNITEEKLY